MLLCSGLCEVINKRLKNVLERTEERCVHVCVCPALFVMLTMVFGGTLLVCQTDSLRCRNRFGKQKQGGLELSL